MIQVYIREFVNIIFFHPFIHFIHVSQTKHKVVTTNLRALAALAALKFFYLCKQK
jgi:hypothetical protein